MSDLIFHIFVCKFPVQRRSNKRLRTHDYKEALRLYQHKKITKKI